MSGCRVARTDRRVAGLLLGLVLAGACAGGSPPPPAVVAQPPSATLDQKVAWILRLEQQRVLADPAITSAPGATAAAFSLGQLLQDADPTIRARAALAVGRVGMADGGPLLAAALTDPAPSVRATAAFGLGLIGRAEAPPWLEPLLVDPSLVVRRRVIEALALLGDAGAAPAIAQAGAGCGAMMAGIAPDDETWPMSPEIEVCRQVLFALARLGTFDALAQVALDAGGRPVARWWPVAYALQRVGDRRAATYLQPLLSTSGTYTPAFALRGLTAAGDRSVLPQALAIAGRSDAAPVLRVAAVGALGALGDETAVGPLLQLLADASLPTTLVVEVVDALGALGSAEAFDALVELLNDTSPAVRAAALSAVARSNPNAFMLVLSGLGRDDHWSVRAALAGVLATLPADRVETALDELAGDPDARVHGPALEALVTVLGDAAVPRLFAALAAPDFVERATAARLIGQLEPSGGVAALAAAYDRGDSDTAFVARGAALQALAAYGDDASRTVLHRALGDREWAIRWRAADLLRGLGEAEAAPDRPAPVRQGLDFFRSPELLHPAYSPHAFVETRLGTIEIELNVVEGTVTSASFIEQARAGLFNGLRIHRVEPGFVVQAGDPRGDGEGGPGYTVRDELSEVPFLRGTVGLARDWPETGGSQWFVTLSPQPYLEARYTAFGRVVSGWDVLDRLAPWDTIERVRIWDGIAFR